MKILEDDIKYLNDLKFTMLAPEEKESVQTKVMLQNNIH